MANEVAQADGTVDFSGGVNSVKVTTVKSPRNPNGLSRNELSWLNNGEVRDGGITQRYGYVFKGRMFPADGVFQGAFMYDSQNGSSYPIVAKGGNIYRINPETAAATNLSSTAFVREPFQIGVYMKNLNAAPGSTLIVESGTEANTTVGIIGNITAPAINGTVFVALGSPYSGPSGITIPITGRFTITAQAVGSAQASGSNVIWNYTVTLRNETYPAGTVINVQPIGGVETSGGLWSRPDGGLIIHWTVQNFVTPAIGATVDVTFTSEPVFSSSADPFTIPTTLLFNQINLQLVNAGVSGTDQGTHPAHRDYFYFRQAEEFLIIQAGDYSTLPLFWDGAALRRSLGITDTAIGSHTNGVNEIPSAGPMDYYMGRLWYAQRRQYSAGDVVGGASGSSAYNFRDSVLQVTENPLALGGDGFRVPDSSGDITALCHNANIDAALGQGRLFISTLKTIYSLTVPVTRTDWIAANNSNQPLQTVVQLANGSVNDRSIVPVNGDLFFMSLEPAIRSLMTAVRNFGKWGNIPFSANETRALQFVDRSLLRFASGINFNNRLLMTTLPRQVAQGVFHQGIIPLDFMPISSFEEQTSPIWGGIHQGLNVLQLLVGRINDVERAFAICLSDDGSGFDLWELTLDQRFDVTPEITQTSQEKRVKWQIEFPAFNWGQEFELKKIVACELWVDRMFGEVLFELDYRPDGDPCWHLWHKWIQCSARNSCEDVFNPICYPIQPFLESYRATMITPTPPESECASVTGRPAHTAYQIQPRLTITGFCRVRGILLWAESVDRELYGYIFTCALPTQ